MPWKNILGQFVDEPYEYLKEYYQRNQSESAFSEDKMRLGWMIHQRREDRVETNDALNFLWHNLLGMGVLNFVPHPHTNIYRHLFDFDYFQLKPLSQMGTTCLLFVLGGYSFCDTVE